MTYECYLLHRCNVAHMRLFSVFLALPSATVRLMAARQLQVDYESREEVDEEVLELGEATAGTTAGNAAVGTETGAEGEKKQKSVRMFVEGALAALTTRIKPASMPDADVEACCTPCMVADLLCSLSSQPVLPNTVSLA
eukprot:GHRQ01037096.1.p1 GENE.GHRQ01037096.1~~GHRQ01037096.1.p1  ORF type:complete len:139 (+),score=38.64 GHRQ01037096.1:114-530(+)